MALHDRGRRLGISVAALMALVPAAVVVRADPLVSSTPTAAVAAAGARRAPPPPPAAPVAQLPCPLEAGWETLLSLRLPRRDGSGQPSGGFSAVAYDPVTDQLELLSDAPRGFVQRWSGLRRLVELAGQPGMKPAPSLQPLGVVVLRRGAAPLPTVMDGEGVVRRGQDVWVASEGRRSTAQPALLLRFDAVSGALRQALELPMAWQPAPGRGLEGNKGPESLTLWRQASGADTLLMASETALLQDPAGQARLLEWELSASGATARPLRSLALPGGGVWSLTELLVLPQPRGASGLLALLRRFEEPDRWGARLLLYPPPSRVAGADVAPNAGGEANRTSPMAPIHSWNLLASGPGHPGLPPDNWEGLSWGPTLADGRATLVLVSDDNFSPFQDNWLAVLAPRRLASCRAKPS
ncbi:MAG: esterase-like activity of phytase family protein [Synechococcaceae cyanobacterium]|nr:esterase-like activity of phytase family protein [Synechococcaceae cyanobacterium]